MKQHPIGSLCVIVDVARVYNHKASFYVFSVICPSVVFFVDIHQRYFALKVYIFFFDAKVRKNASSAEVNSSNPSEKFGVKLFLLEENDSLQ